MRGSDLRTGELFSYVDLEERVPAKHPLRVILRIVNEVLAALDAEFARLYAATGRPSIAPERLLRALLLQAFYGVRSERQLMEQVSYNMLFRWFLDMEMTDAPFDPTVFSHNRKRLLERDVAGRFLATVVEGARKRGLMSSEHFAVDGTLIEAAASFKSFQPKTFSVSSLLIWLAR